MKRFVRLRVLYYYSFAFDLVELGECTRIRGSGLYFHEPLYLTLPSSMTVMTSASV